MKQDKSELIWAVILCAFSAYVLYKAIFLHKLEIICVLGGFVLLIVLLLTSWVLVDGIITIVFNYFKGKWK